MKALLINKIVLFFVLIVFASCNSQVKKEIKDKDYSETFIEKIKNLDVVKNKKSELEAIENKKIEFDYYLRDKPNKENKYYIIQVGKSNEYRFEVFFNFYCDTISNQIKLYDSLKDTLIDTKQKNSYKKTPIARIFNTSQESKNTRLNISPK